eukprot:scaffold257374_cov43-Tisochrysis_lutea.AAC.1
MASSSWDVQTHACGWNSVSCATRVSMTSRGSSANRTVLSSLLMTSADGAIDWARVQRSTASSSNRRACGRLSSEAVPETSAKCERAMRCDLRASSERPSCSAKSHTSRQFHGVKSEQSAPLAESVSASTCSMCAARSRSGSLPSDTSHSPT